MASRTVIESYRGAAQTAAVAADVDRRARVRNDAAGSGAGQSPPQQAPPAADGRQFATVGGREAHLESAAQAEGQIRKAALERFGAHLVADENLGRRMRTNARRALAEIGYLTDAEKRALENVGLHAMGNLAEISEKYKRTAIGAKALAGIPEGIKGPRDWSPSGSGGLGDGGELVGYGKGKGGPPGTPGTGPDLTDYDGWEGGPRWGGPPGVGRDFSGIGIDLNSPRGSTAGPWPNQPGAPRGSDKWAAAEGLYVPPQADPNVGAAWDNAQMSKAGQDAQTAERSRARETLEREAAEQAYQDELFSPAATGGDAAKPAVLRADFIKPEPPPPPKPDGSNPNPEGTGGPGPVGPWSRGGSSARYASVGREAIPNPEGTGGPGPIGPWSRGGSREQYGSLGREATPNPEGTGGPGPVGPWSRTRSRGVYGSYGREAMPDPDAPGRGGPVGPAT